MLEFRDVSFKYKEDDEILFKNLSFFIEQNEFVAIVGASGCGKSTIFRLINGLEGLQSGEIFWRGRKLAEVDHLFNAFMPQNDLLLPWRTTLKNVEMPLELESISKAERGAGLRIIRNGWTCRMGKRLAARISGGMRQRVSFARTLDDRRRYKEIAGRAPWCFRLFN